MKLGRPSLRETRGESSVKGHDKPFENRKKQFQNEILTPTHRETAAGVQNIVLEAQATEGRPGLKVGGDEQGKKVCSTTKGKKSGGCTIAPKDGGDKKSK